MTKKVAAIWAQDLNGLIGVDGHLPWHLPAELKHFKETTMAQAILMGRKTFDGMDQRVLPGRTTLVLTKNKDYQAENVIVLHSLSAVKDWFSAQDKDLYVIGGAEMFTLFSSELTELIETVVDGEFSGDTYFPKDFPWQDFQLTNEKKVLADEKNAYNFTVRSWQRV